MLLTAKRVIIRNMLVEGMSMRLISRTVGVSFNTVTKLMIEDLEGAFGGDVDCAQIVKIYGERARKYRSASSPGCA